jgi:hypothetical protein
VFEKSKFKLPSAIRKKPSMNLDVEPRIPTQVTSLHGFGHHQKSFSYLKSATPKSLIFHQSTEMDLVCITSMTLNYIREKIFPIVKIISIILITNAIALELWNIQTLITNSQLPTILTPALFIAHFALSAHFIEALIAAYYLPIDNQTSIKYAAYTFLVGTVGLLELWKNNDQ